MGKDEQGWRGKGEGIKMDDKDGGMGKDEWMGKDGWA
mgnify:CR=1 FL=1